MTLDRLLWELNDLVAVTGRDPRTVEVAFTTLVYPSWDEPFTISRDEATASLVNGVLEIELL